METPPTPDTDPGVPRGVRTVLLLAWLAIITALALTVLDYRIKGEIVRRAKQLHDDLEGVDDGGEPGLDGRAAAVSGAGGLGGVGPDPGAPADGVASRGLAHGAGGLLARRPGDGSLGDGS